MFGQHSNQPRTHHRSAHHRLTHHPLTHHRRANYRRAATGLAVLGAAALLAACGSGGGSNGSNGNSGGTPSGGVPTANLPVLKHIGKGEGQLNLIAWTGYLDPSWVKPFEQQTGCQVNSKYANTSDEMVALMADGGGGQYDMVSSSGDADLRIIYGGNANPVNGVHYGVSLQWGPNVLMYSKKAFKTAPPSWDVIYSKKHKGQITVPDNPIQIADAAVYLKTHDKSLGITDPYELTQPQFDAAVKLLADQRSLLKSYWALASQEISAFKNGDVVVGAGWPYQVSALEGTKFPIGSTIPSEGATGWADTWMLAAKAPHPNCAYMWMRYISTPKVQAMQAVTYGETPDNKLACSYMDKIQAGSCAQYHANAPAAYLNSVALWKTPVATCDNGKPDCVPYSQWVTAWNTQVK